jgi:hypothetical protein
MSQFSDSDLERVLGDTLAAGREVPEEWREAARAAYTWRTVDEELLSLTHDSLQEAGVAVRGDEEPRTLEFSGAGLTLEVERDGRRVAGRLAPPAAGEVVLELPDGERRSVLADESGFFVLDTVEDGLVRFAVRAGQQRLVTEWVSL